MFCNRLWSIFGVVFAVWFSAGNVSAEMIHLMARKGDVEAVMAEIDKGVDVDLPSTRHTTEVGVSPLFIAARFGKADVVVALIGAGADVGKLFKHTSAYTYGTPLHVAASSGSVEVVEVLLEAGADPNVYEYVVGTPLHLAIQFGHSRVAQTLIAAGAAVRVVQPPISSKLAEASLALGKEVISGCVTCHSLVAEGHDPRLVGPPLWSIIGRPIASFEGFEYSSSMAAENGTWDYETLNSFLAAPKLYMPGTKMWASAIDDVTRRASAIAYLRTLADNPLPLP